MVFQVLQKYIFHSTKAKKKERVKEIKSITPKRKFSFFQN